MSGSSKLAKIIDGSVSFDGTGDLLSVPDSDDFHLGTNDFTIEYFVYKNSTQGTNSHHVSQYGTSNANRSFAFRSVALPFTDLQFRWYNGSNEYTMNWSEGWMRAQEGWKHICVQRKSGDLYLYIDGKLWKTETGSSAALSINNSTAPLTIGGDSNTGSEYYLNGSISNFRLINGTAIYRTGGFAPPTAPLTNVTNTKLLCCQSNTLAGSAVVAPSISGLNDGRVWSSGSTTGSVYASDNDWNNVFNGVAGNDKAIAANDATYEITLPGGGISGVTKVEIYGQQQSGSSNATITLSSAGEQSVAQGTSLGYTTFYTGSSDTLTKLKVASTGSNEASINAVRINDTTILTDPLANSVGASPDAVATTFNPFNTDINTVRGQETGYCTWDHLRYPQPTPHYQMEIYHLLVEVVIQINVWQRLRCHLVSSMQNLQLFREVLILD